MKDTPRRVARYGPRVLAFQLDVTIEEEDGASA
jgi:hypothetical protein